MKYKVKIDGQFYDVEVGNLSDRPIITSVNGETFEVWPESSLPQSPSQTQYILNKESTSAVVHALPKSSIQLSEPVTTLVQSSVLPSSSLDTLQTINAPIPGVITAILIQPGADVTVGQELCKLEAMKMNNSIRAAKSGKIGIIHVAIGQHVKHNEVLIEYVG